MFVCVCDLSHDPQPDPMLRMYLMYNDFDWLKPCCPLQINRTQRIDVSFFSGVCVLRIKVCMLTRSSLWSSLVSNNLHPDYMYISCTSNLAPVVVYDLLLDFVNINF